jgi:hypothetical protein
MGSVAQRAIEPGDRVLGGEQAEQPLAGEQRIPHCPRGVPGEGEVVSEDLRELLGSSPRPLLHPGPDHLLGPGPARLRDRGIRNVAGEDVVEDELAFALDRRSVALAHEALADELIDRALGDW